MVIRAECAVPLGFGLPSPLHDSMQDISLQERRLYALFVSGFTGQKSIYSARRKDLGRSSEGAVDYDKLSQAMQRGIRPIRHLRANRRLSAELAPDGPQDWWTCYSRPTGICSARISK
jgi:hypothetical protein